MSELSILEGESTCFYHPDKRASIPCGQCGRFLCALCDLELNGEHICPACLDLSRTKRPLPALERHRTLYGRVALWLALAPMLMWPLTLVTAPATLVVVGRYWKAPGSIVRSSKVPLVIAAVLAVLQIAAWIVLASFIVIQS